MHCGIYRERILHHFKEHMVKYFFQSNNILFIHKKPISASGSKYRPDFLIKSNFGYIIVEVDEHQHKTEQYTMEKETFRMCMIYKDIQIINPQKLKSYL